MGIVLGAYWAADRIEEDVYMRARYAVEQAVINAIPRATEHGIYVNTFIMLSGAVFPTVHDCVEAVLEQIVYAAPED